MIRWLSCWWCFFSWISNNSKSWFICNNIYVLNLIDWIVCSKFWFENHFLKPLKCSCRLMLIRSKFKMHTHHSKIITFIWNCNIKWRWTICFFKKSENSLRISKNVFWTYKSSHSSFNAHNCSFSSYSCRCSFRVT